MNLKEAFRYQSFLTSLVGSARDSLLVRQHALKTTSTHLRSKANPDAEDIVQEDEVPKFFPNDDVIRFMVWLADERENLSSAIGAAKYLSGFDLDSAIEANKFRQRTGAAIKDMLRYKESKTTIQGRDYKFNSEGNQMPYIYDIEVVNEEAFDRTKAKEVLRSILAKSDEVSNEIDRVLVNTQVKYEPTFDVNDTFEDAMEVFMLM